MLQLGLAEAVAPAIWQQEILNSLGKAVSRKRLDLSKALELWQQLRDLPIVHLEVRSDEDLLRLALQQNLSIYDASYLSLAIKHNIPLATFDSKLTDAAGRLGVPIFQSRLPGGSIQ